MSNQSLVMYRVGGRYYPYKSARGCRVCQSEHRDLIEQWFVQPRSPHSICRQLPDGHEIRPSHIVSHVRRGHLPLEHEVVRSLLERRARVRGASLETAAEQLADHVTLAELTVQRTFSRLATGDLVPSLDQGLAAARILAALGDEVNPHFDQQVMVRAYMAYMETAQAMMTPEQFAQFTATLNDHPELRALNNQVAAASRPRVIEATVLEDDEDDLDSVDGDAEDRGDDEDGEDGEWEEHRVELRPDP